MDQLLSDATSELGNAQLIMYNLINASKAGQRCNELVAVLYGKGEQQESWKLLGLDKAEFNKKIHYDEIVAPAVGAFCKTDIRRKECLDHINKV